MHTNAASEANQAVPTEDYQPPVGGGGGCTEAWEAMSEYREENSTSDPTHAQSRRETLTQSVAMLGSVMGGTAFASSAAATSVDEQGQRTGARKRFDGNGEHGAAAGDPPETPPGQEEGDDHPVTPLEGRKAKRWRGRALSDPEFKQIFHYFIHEKDWQPKLGEASVTETDLPDGGTTHAVVVPFFAPDHEDAYISWSSEENWRSHGMHVVHTDENDDGEFDHYRITEYAVENSTVVSETELRENFLGCDSVNWVCVGKIAASYAGLYAACATCSVSLTPPACVACIGAVLTWGVAIQCDWCND